MFPAKSINPYEGTAALKYKKEEAKKSNKKVKKKSTLLTLQKQLTFLK